MGWHCPVASETGPPGSGHLRAAPSAPEAAATRRPREKARHRVPAGRVGVYTLRRFSRSWGDKRHVKFPWKASLESSLQPPKNDAAVPCIGHLTLALMNAVFGAIPILFRNPSVYGLSRITNSLFISNGEAANNKLFLYANRITTVINATVEVVDTYFPDIYYIHVPVLDYPTARIYDFFDPVADKIQAVDRNQGRTLVHCAAGVSRSAALCIAYLMKYHSMSLFNAHDWVKSCRPVIRPNLGFWEQLVEYEYHLFGKNSVKMIQSPLGRIPDLYENEVRVMISL